MIRSLIDHELKIQNSHLLHVRGREGGREGGERNC